MAVIKQEDARDDLKRKSKKRKKRDALGGEDGNIQIDDKGHRKKKKETLVGTNASEVATDVYSNFGAKNSRKEKEEIGTNRIKKEEEVTDSKMEKKKKKNKTGVEGGASQAEIVSEEIEPMEDRNKKKKKKAAAEDEVNDSSGSEKMKKRNKSGDGGVSWAEDVSEEVEPVDDRKREKKKKEAEDKVNDRKMMKKNKSGDEGGASLVEDVSEEVKPMEDRKREKKRKKKKKAEDDSRAGYSEKEFLNNSDEHSINSGEEDGATGRRRKKETPFRSTLGGTRAGASEAEGNGAADHTLFVENLNEKIKSVKVKKRKNKKKDDLGVGSSDEELVTNTSVPSISNGKSSRDRSSKKKKKFIGSNTEGDCKTGALKTSKMKNPIESSERSTPGKKSKVVRFSDRVEFLSLADNSRGTEKLKDHSKGKKKVGRLRRGKVSSKAEHQIVENSELNHKENNQTKKVDDGLIRGKRFSKEEDEIVKNSVLNYIERHQLGEMGLEMVLKCSNYPEVRDCWREIGEALPSRPYLSVYNRAHILFERSESRQWTPEEIEFVKEFHKKYGPDWKTLADELGKHRIHVKDTWRRIRYTNMKKGHWSQDEYESLFDLVNTDLKLKAFEEKRSKHGMLRDNISWEAIGYRLSTRGYALCCQKWYDQLTSPMVAEGIWADVDDYRLIIALDELDAACLEDVDWDNLLEHRPGDVCRKRWNQMVRNIGEHGTKSFGEQVEILSKRYCPDLLDARVAYDSKTPVD